MFNQDARLRNARPLPLVVWKATTMVFPRRQPRAGHGATEHIGRFGAATVLHLDS
jgi:hypothetical protein